MFVCVNESSVWMCECKSDSFLSDWMCFRVSDECLCLECVWACGFKRSVPFPNVSHLLWHLPSLELNTVYTLSLLSLTPPLYTRPPQQGLPWTASLTTLTPYRGASRPLLHPSPPPVHRHAQPTLGVSGQRARSIYDPCECMCVCECVFVFP